MKRRRPGETHREFATRIAHEAGRPMVRPVPVTPKNEVIAAERIGLHASKCGDCGPTLITFALVCHFHKAVPAAPLAETMCALGRGLLAEYEKVAT